MTTDGKMAKLTEDMHKTIVEEQKKGEMMDRDIINLD